MMSPAAATALSFSLAALVLLWLLVFELLPDFAADYRRHKRDDPPGTT
jgi:hypothetical protein